VGSGSGSRGTDRIASKRAVPSTASRSRCASAGGRLPLDERATLGPGTGAAPTVKTTDGDGQQSSPSESTRTTRSEGPIAGKGTGARRTVRDASVGDDVGLAAVRVVSTS